MAKNVLTPILKRFCVKQKDLLVTIGLSDTYANLKGEPTRQLLDALLNSMPFLTEDMIRGKESLNTVKDVLVDSKTVLSPSQVIDALAYAYRTDVRSFARDCSNAANLPLHESELSYIKNGTRIFNEKMIDAIMKAHPELSRKFIETGKQPMFSDGRCAPLAVLTNAIEVVYLDKQYTVKVVSAKDRKHGGTPQRRASAPGASTSIAGLDAAINRLNNVAAGYEKKLAECTQLMEKLTQREEAIAEREAKLAEREALAYDNIKRAIDVATGLQVGAVAEDSFVHPDLK